MFKNIFKKLVVDEGARTVLIFGLENDIINIFYNVSLYFRLKSI